MLHLFEDKRNERLGIHVRAPSPFGGGEESIASTTYVCPPAGGTSTLHLELQVGFPWDYADFREKHLKSFVDSVVLPYRKSIESGSADIDIDAHTLPPAQAA